MKPNALRMGLIALVFAAPTIQYRLEFGLFSMALLEPVGLLAVAGLWWLRPPAVAGQTSIMPADPLARFALLAAAAIVAWSAALGLWAASWRDWAADLRNWLIPALVFGALVLWVRDGWRTWTLLFVFVGLAQAGLALYQYMTNSFRPFAAPNAFYKAGFTFDPATNRPTLASFGLGLFSHPNSLALYLIVALLVGLGWWMLGGGRRLKTAALLALILGLATTYAKVSIVVALGGVGAALFHQRIRSNRRFVAAGAAALAAGAAGAWLVSRLAANLWLATFEWRVGLWGSALDVIAAHPGTLAIGNAMDDYARVAVYPQPHNLAFYMVLAYGLAGLAWVAIPFWRFHREAWRLRGAGVLHSQPLLAMLWIGMWAFLAVSALETPFVSIEWRMIWLLVLACFVGLRRETLEPRDAR